MPRRPATAPALPTPLPAATAAAAAAVAAACSRARWWRRLLLEQEQLSLVHASATVDKRVRHRRSVAAKGSYQSLLHCRVSSSAGNPDRLVAIVAKGVVQGRVERRVVKAAVCDRRKTVPVAGRRR